MNTGFGVSRRLVVTSGPLAAVSAAIAPGTVGSAAITAPTAWFSEKFSALTCAFGDYLRWEAAWRRALSAWFERSPPFERRLADPGMEAAARRQADASERAFDLFRDLLTASATTAGDRSLQAALLDTRSVPCLEKCPSTETVFHSRLVEVVLCRDPAAVGKTTPIGAEKLPLRLSYPGAFDDIIDLSARSLGVSREAVLSADRSRSVVRARQVGMYLAKRFTGRSLPEIGRRFGGRDHTTVLHAHRKIEGLVASDADMACAIEQLARRVQRYGALRIAQFSASERQG